MYCIVLFRIWFQPYPVSVVPVGRRFIQPAATNLVQAGKVVHNSLPERASLKQYKSKVGQTGKHITINWLRLSL